MRHLRSAHFQALHTPLTYQYLGVCGTEAGSLTPKISRRDITRKTLELTNTKVKAVKSGLDITKCRGYFLAMTNTEARLVQQFGCNVIVIARDLNYCWQRFVYTKELMHLFDIEDEQTTSTESFEKLLTEFGQPALERSPQIESEVKALWMALACFCPEKNRLEFKAQLDKGHIDNYSIALQLRIPEQYIPALFSPSYSDVIAQLIS